MLIEQLEEEYRKNPEDDKLLSILISNLIESRQGNLALQLLEELLRKHIFKYKTSPCILEMY